MSVTRFSTLPEDLNQMMFNLAIRSHFDDEVANQIWYSSWLHWYRGFLDSLSEEYRDKLETLVDYILYDSEDAIMQEKNKNKINPGDLEIEFVDTEYGLFVSYYIHDLDIYRTLYIMTASDYNNMLYNPLPDPLITIRYRGNYGFAYVALLDD
jgi:hypothetical protein